MLPWDISVFLLFVVSFLLWFFVPCIHRELFLLCFLFFLLLILFISCACVEQSPSLPFSLSVSGYLCESSTPFLQSHLRIQVWLCFMSALVYMSLCAVSIEIVFWMCEVCWITTCVLDAISAHSYSQNALMFSSVSEFKRLWCHRLLCGRLTSRGKGKGKKIYFWKAQCLMLLRKVYYFGYNWTLCQCKQIVAFFWDKESCCDRMFSITF